MATNITPEELRTSGNYELVKELGHDEIIDFVASQLKKLRWPMVFFYGFNILLAGLIALYTAGNVFHSYISWGAYWKYLILGLVTGMLVVIPFHEIIHGIAYKIAGAPRIKFGANLKQMMFYAAAPGFVATRQDFYLVAFSPFALINILFLSGMLFGTPPLQWASLVALFIHSTMCVGDFAMVNYFAAFPGKKCYTYDDDSDNRSYFFLRN
jgi:hypothetical protein